MAKWFILKVKEHPLADLFGGIKEGWNKGWQRGAPPQPFFTGTTMSGRTDRYAQEKELAETKQLYTEVKSLFDASLFADANHAPRFIARLVIETCEHIGCEPTSAIGIALFETTRQLLTEEGSLFGFPDIDWSRPLGMDQGVALRTYLTRKKRFLEDREYLTDLWCHKVLSIYVGILSSLPASAFDHLQTEDDESELTFQVPLLDYIDSPPEALERLIVTLFDNDIVHAELFEDVRDVIDHNIRLASGIDPLDPDDTDKAYVLPTGQKSTSTYELVDLYVRSTPFAHFFSCELPITIPQRVRFEHCHLVGGTGHGKTQLMQLLIHNDLLRARDGNCSVVVVDSQGDLIRTISHLAYFSPDAEQSLADKLLIIDPNDIAYPVALNMFDVNMERIGGYDPVEREKILNGTIELYEYIFGALLGAELTQKQGVIFRYLARLMLAIPDATVQTLRELMEDGRPFKPYMEQLEGTSRKFFETQFFHPSFNATKNQILKRLWGVLANTTFERLFSNPRNKVDIFDAMNSGKVIFINTAKDLLKQEGCEIFGRFFVAMIAQATMERATLAASDRTPTFIYIDEAQDYLDERCEQLFNQARKYNVAIHVAHQNLGQIGEKLKQSIMASTSTKLAGGVSAKDAQALSHEMRCRPEFIQDIHKSRDQTEFACWIKHVTPEAIRLAVPLGSVESLPTLSETEYTALVERNRRRYATPAEEVAARLSAPTSIAPIPAPSAEPERPPTEPPGVQADATEPREAKSRLGTPLAAEVDRSRPASRARERPPAPPPPMGRGGKEHKYLQSMIKQMAEDRGFLSIIEHEILDGTGSIDVALKRDDISLACEISITTTAEHELGNIRKCLAAEFEEVAIISSDAKHLRSIKKFVSANLEAPYADRVSFFRPEEFADYLDEIDARSQAKEETVRGYRVKVTHARVDSAEATQRKKAVAQVIARSLTQMQEKPT